MELLRYLVERLLLVERISDGESFRLVLDPLADDLAALGWLRQLAREGDGAWERFLGQTLPDPGSEAAALAQGFLRALYDCGVPGADRAVLGLEVPPVVVARLAERAAIDPQRIARERQWRQVLQHSPNRPTWLSPTGALHHFGCYLRKFVASMDGSGCRPGEPAAIPGSRQSLQPAAIDKADALPWKRPVVAMGCSAPRASGGSSMSCRN